MHGGGEEVFLGRDLLKERNYSEELAYEVDKEISNLVDEAYREAHNILEKNKNKLIELAGALEKKEVLEESDIKEILKTKVTVDDTQKKIIPQKTSEPKTKRKVVREKIKNIVPEPPVESYKLRKTFIFSRSFDICRHRILF